MLRQHQRRQPVWAPPAPSTVTATAPAPSGSGVAWAGNIRT